MAMSLREKVAFYLEDIDTPMGRGINLTITGLVLISSAIFVIETYKIPIELRQRLNLIEDIILAIFVVEYCLRLWCAENRFRHIFSLFSIIDFLSIAPFFLGTINVGFLRIFRWFRILRLIRFISGRTIFGYVSSEDIAIFVRILFTLFSIIFVYSGLIYQTEHTVNPKYATFLDAIYFSVSTITTAGFGDITPATQLGKFLTILMILTGIVLIPWQLGDLVKRLVKTTEQIQTVCSGCGLAFHDSDARFCKVCGTELKRSQPAEK